MWITMNDAFLSVVQNIYDEDENNFIQLFGYTSCSIAKDAAMTFIWENENTGHQKVLFHIRWLEDYSNYFLDAGAYDNEHDVLLMGGVSLCVK